MATEFQKHSEFSSKILHLFEFRIIPRFFVFVNKPDNGPRLLKDKPYVAFEEESQLNYRYAIMKRWVPSSTKVAMLLLLAQNSSYAIATCYSTRFVARYSYLIKKSSGATVLATATSEQKT